MFQSPICSYNHNDTELKCTSTLHSVIGKTENVLNPLYSGDP